MAKCNREFFKKKYVKKKFFKIVKAKDKISNQKTKAQIQIFYRLKQII